jgi:hypothetical protein
MLRFVPRLGLGASPRRAALSSPSGAVAALRTAAHAESSQGTPSRHGAPVEPATGKAGDTAAAGRRRDRSRLSSASTRPPNAATIGEQLRELKRVTVERGGTASVDEGLLPAAGAHTFPAREMTSLSGGRVVIQDAASAAGVTLVLLAFRSFADDQLASWRAPFANAFGGRDVCVQTFDVSVNETFAAQMLSGFVQRLQRSKIASGLHEHHVALNAEAGASIEAILPSKNRLFGYALLLDRDGRVRFRAAGTSTAASQAALVAAAEQLLLDDAATTSGGGRMVETGGTRRSHRGRPKPLR